MRGRRWHMEHADGSEWGQDELDALWESLDYRDSGDVLFPALREGGSPVLVNNCTRDLTPDDDVTAVWDE